MNGLSSPIIGLVRYDPSPAQGAVAKRVGVREREILDERTGARPVPRVFEPLPRLIRELVAYRWRVPCEEAFEFLASYQPDALLDWIASGALDPASLTFAAEIAGRIRDADRVRATLLPLLDHERALVREGAIYGLAHCLDGEVRRRLVSVADRDESQAVREVAREVLDA